MTRRSIIEDIRAQYTGLKDMPRKSLASSIRTLAEDLYSRDTHFVFELIQNAEDNDYRSGVPPSLHFRLTSLEIEGSTTQALVVFNNEQGFTEEHVRALCQVGQTTKKKQLGYIGEKGIGFKSVFKVTACPYIFSNGFQFALPEDDPETGLGYIVPRWVDSPPTCAKKAGTCFVLPFNKPTFDPAQIIDTFKRLGHETVLFLRKLKAVHISIESESDPFSIVMAKDDSHAPLVKLTVCRSTAKRKKDITVHPFWVIGRELQKPDVIHADRREAVATTPVTVAIPLGEATHAGSCFAYLPVWESTGLPFLINADFLLVSSREGIREDEPWNQWLRDQIADIYSEAFLSAVKTDNLSEQQRLRAYASLPITSRHEFLEPVVTAIYKRLKNAECIITSRDSMLVQPKTCRSVPGIFRHLLEPAHGTPVPLPAGVKFIHVGLDRMMEPLKKLGVGGLLQKDVLEALSCDEWLKRQSHSWFVELYRALASFSPDTLRGIPIIPVTLFPDSDSKLTCDARQPVYFPADGEPADLLCAAPAWLRQQIPLSFLEPHLHELILKQKDASDLLEWMTKELNVYTFSLQNYCVDIINHLSKMANTISSNNLIDATRFLAKHTSDNIDWSSLPIVLSDGRVMQLSSARELRWNSYLPVQEIVRPEARQVESGWHHIWCQPADRVHFVALHSMYRSLPAKWFEAVNIKAFPGFVPALYTRSSEIIMEAEKGLWTECHRSAASSRSGATHVWSWLPPTILSEDVPISRIASRSLLSFLRSLPEDPPAWSHSDHLHDIGLRAKGSYEHYGTHTRYEPSTVLILLRSRPWLPSTKGLVRPNQAFLRKQGVHEVLGDTVPYLIGDLPEWIQRELGIKQEVSVAALLDTLKSYQKQSDGELQMTKRVYAALHTYANASAPALKTEFEKYGLVYLPEDEAQGRWLKPSACLWADSSHVFGGAFACLAKIYPTLRDFFVNIVGVKDDVDTECYARRWLELQNSHIPGNKAIRPVVEKLYRSIIVEVRVRDHSTWWEDFRTQAKLYTQNDTFETPAHVFVPDDGKLKAQFQDTVGFAWRPPNDSFDDWQDLYVALGALRLTESVSVTVAGDIATSVAETNQYLTPAAVQMIASWLREKRPTVYETRSADGTLRDLATTRESAAGAELILNLRLAAPGLTKEISAHAAVHWERAKKELILLEPRHASRRLIAESLARGLSDARTFHDLADWIELVAGEQDTKRLSNRGWSVPREMQSEMVVTAHDQAPSQGEPTPPPAAGGMPSEEMSTAPLKHHQATPHVVHRTAKATKATEDECAPGQVLEVAPVDAEITPSEDRSETVEPVNRVENQTTSPHDSAQYADMLRQAFVRPGKTQLDADSIPPGGNTSQELPNADRRRERIGVQHRTRITEEPPPEDRRRTTERVLLEPADPLVRTQLDEWYHGRCQVCEAGAEPWPEHNGQPFFVSARLVERSNARWLDDVANAVCLCADHFAQWRHAAKEGPPDIVQAIQSLDPETSSHDLQIAVKLAGVSHAIRYGRKHVIALQELIRASQTPDEQQRSDCSSDEAQS